MRTPPRSLCSVLLAGMLLFCGHVQAVLFTDFNEFGATLNGYQDDFNGASLNGDWLLFGGDPGSFTVAGDGTLNITTTAGGAGDDPNKLLYNPGTAYDASIQEVLVLMKVNSDNTADGFRSGPATASSTVNGQGINLHFRHANPGGTTEHFNLLNDQIAWGPTVSGAYTNGVYYWLRVRHSPNSSGLNDAFGKVWPAGTGEPAAFQTSWDYQVGAGVLRTGLAGIAGPSLGTPTDVSVDYVLIKASGLPSISVVPEPGSLAALGFGLLALARRQRR